ncbi:hypothetical protein ACFPYN_11035 [Paenisporosarcina macmurdoensis]|uniref:Uncharacterized protein n=1 Tax=Paenisporosarcina macmurdoensis TaxID=212659 RepID=A0ABW1L7L5_9BACL
MYLDSNGLNGAIIGVSSNDTKAFYEFEEYDQELFEGVIHTLRDKGTIVKEVTFLHIIEIGTMTFDEI